MKNSVKKRFKVTKKKTLLLATLSLSFIGMSAYAFNFKVSKSLNKFLKSNLNLRTPISMETACNKIDRIEESKELIKVLEHLLKEQMKITGTNRHNLNRKLNHCTPRENSEALIIAFEGTGAYEPRIPPLINSLLQCAGDKINKELIDDIYDYSRVLLRRETGESKIKWSGLNTGVLLELFKVEKGNLVDWFSFPSEESEALSDVDSLKNYSFRQLVRDVRSSVNSRPEGIKSAMTCIRHYTRYANAMNIKPKIILTSHSSGARSLVKFSEQIKGIGVDVDLAFTIDPIKEAHEAVKEVLPQKIGEPARWAQYEWDRFWGKNPDYPYSKVWSRHQPSSLYKPSNVSRHVSFFQLDDTLGLKIGGDAMRFGILGSRIHKADENYHIRNKGSSGHGTITYDKKVLTLFQTEIKELLK